GTVYTASNGITLVGADFQINPGFSNTWTAVQNFNNNFTVGSTAKINNLNADLLDGYDSTYFLNVGQTGALPYVNDVTNTTLTRSGAGPYTLALNLANANTWTATQTFQNNFAVGSPALINNLNADLLDGKHADDFLQVGGTGYDNYRYWTASANGVNRQVGSTSTFNFVGANGVGLTLSGNTLTINGTTYAAGIALSLTPANVFNLRYDNSLAVNGSNQLGLNLANSNRWTALQRFTAGIGVTGNSTFTNNLSVGQTLTTTTLKATNAQDTTMISNLNADLLDGKHASDFVGTGDTGNFLTDITAGVGITVSGSGTTRQVALTNTGVATGSYGGGGYFPTFTVDAQGRLTAAGQIPIPQGTVYTASNGVTLVGNDFQIDHDFSNTWTGVQTFQNNFNVGSSALISNLNAQYLNGHPDTDFLHIGGTGFFNTATNGLQAIGVTGVGLGGTLTQNTLIELSSFNLSFLGLGNTPSLNISSNGNVGVGGALTVSGNITSSGTIRNVTVGATCTTAATTVAKVVTIPNYTLTAGDLISVLFTAGNSASAVTLNVNSTGNKNVRLGNTNVTSVNFTLASGSTVLMYYDGTYFQIMGSQRTTDTNNYDRTYWGNNITAGAAIYDYKLLMQKADGKWYPLTLEEGVGVTKTISTQEFTLNSPILFYATTTNIAPNGTLSNVYSEYPVTRLSYTDNQATRIDRLPLYLKGTVNNNGNFILDNSSYTSFITQSLPTSEDGFVYILLGQMYSTTAFRLFQYHPVYEYRNGKVQPYDPSYGTFVLKTGDTISGNLTIGGTLSLTQGAISGYILSSDASGNASWIAPNSVGVGTTYAAGIALSLTPANVF
ncbi:MAG TPA: hypothetical protein PKN65_10535, partial [Tenuifilaceae bacterium]|nr:hypothetical protein [Tenuifilaceae bacterium]